MFKFLTAKNPPHRFKPEIVRVRLSFPMMTRARCKFCKGLPSIYYFIRNPIMYTNPKDALNRIEKYRGVLTLIGRQPPLYAPKYMQTASPMSHPIVWSKYRPRVHRTRGSNAGMDLVEYVTCECMRSRWAFADQATENRPEIERRKAHHRFPTKFEF